MTASKLFIANLLPHAYPFVLIDKIVNIEDGTRIVCLKNVTINEKFFIGHFIDNPVMPEVLILEAMAQTSGLLLGNNSGNSKFFLAQVQNIRFRGSVIPGDTLFITAVKLKDFGTLNYFNVTADVNNKTVADGELIMAEIKNDNNE